MKANYRNNVDTIPFTAMKHYLTDVYGLTPKQAEETFSKNKVLFKDEAANELRETTDIEKLYIYSAIISAANRENETIYPALLVKLKVPGNTGFKYMVFCCMKGNFGVFPINDIPYENEITAEDMHKEGVERLRTFAKKQFEGITDEMIDEYAKDPSRVIVFDHTSDKLRFANDTEKEFFIDFHRNYCGSIAYFGHIYKCRYKNRLTKCFGVCEVACSTEITAGQREELTSGSGILWANLYVIDKEGGKKVTRDVTLRTEARNFEFCEEEKAMCAK